MISSKSIVVPIVSFVIAFFILISAGIWYTQFSIDQNNRNIAIAEQQAVREAIQRNNQLFCGVIVVINESSKGATVTTKNKNSYGLRLEEDFQKLDKEYKCGT